MAAHTSRLAGIDGAGGGGGARARAEAAGRTLAEGYFRMYGVKTNQPR